MGKTLLGSLGRSASTFLNRTPIPYAIPGSRGFSRFTARPAGQEAQMRAQGANGTLFAIVDRIITSYSQVQWKLYRKAPSGLPEDRVEVTSHALLDLWNSPNAFMTGPAFREAAQQHEELTGEQWWVIARDPRSSIPLELWPARPDRMEPIPDPETFLSSYVYRGPGGEQVPLGLDDVIFQRRPNPLDPYRGLGPVQTILTNLDAARYSAEWNRTFFLNSAEPGGIIQVEKRLSDAEFDEARARWAEQHKGVANAHRVAVLENGLQWVDRKYSMRDMQFAELASVGDETIRGAFGFPKPMTGATDDVNRANADAAELVFSRWLIVPRLERTKAAVNARLLPMFGATTRGMELDYVSPVAEDVEAAAVQLAARATAAATLREAGWNPDDVLSTVGLPAMRFAAPAAVPAAPLTSPPAALLTKQMTFADAVIGLFPRAESTTTWVVKAHEDADICEPCKDNDGHEYATQAAAYADYPGGKGYVNCLGEANCRCVVKESS